MDSTNKQETAMLLDGAALATTALQQVAVADSGVSSAGDALYKGEEEWRANKEASTAADKVTSARFKELETKMALFRREAAELGSSVKGFEQSVRVYAETVGRGYR